MADYQLNNLVSLDFASQGAPYCEGQAKDGVFTGMQSMDYAFQGGPYVRGYFTGATPPAVSSILKVSGVDQASIAAIMGVANASMAKVAGVSNTG